MRYTVEQIWPKGISSKYSIYLNGDRITGMYYIGGMYMITERKTVRKVYPGEKVELFVGSRFSFSSVGPRRRMTEAEAEQLGLNS